MTLIRIWQGFAHVWLPGEASVVGCQRTKTKYRYQECSVGGSPEISDGSPTAASWM